MPMIQLPNITLYYEEYGSGIPILLSHGMGSDAKNWGSAPQELADIGRVIIYDRRGCTRSERPEPYEYTSAAEHAEDAAALLDVLDATPAIIVGRSYAGEVALHVASKYPERVRALVLLEGGGLSLSPEIREMNQQMRGRITTAMADGGPTAAMETLLRGVLGDDGFKEVPEDMKQRIAANVPAILAEMAGEGDQLLDADQLRAITCPALVVSASSSPQAFRTTSEALAETLPNARLAVVEGGHLIAPSHPQVVEFIQAQLAHV